MKRFMNKKVATIGLAAGLLLGAGGAAFAYFTATGTGTGNASGYTAVESTVTAATGNGDLYPGGPDTAVNFTVNNPNPYNIQFTGYTLSNLTLVSGGPCTVSGGTPDVSIASGSGSITALPVAHGATATAGTIPGAISMATTADDGCQGAVFSVTVNLTGTQTP